ncbi:MAG: hypothetical protein ACFE0Q_04460 [Anaerolineae bacterium]
MDEQQPQTNKFPISRILRYGGFAILAIMLMLSVVYQLSNPNATDQERIEATVQAGVDQGLTAVAVETGTPDPTAIQGTVQARIDATLTASVPPTATPLPADISAGERIATQTSGFIGGIFSGIVSIVQGVWNFAGLGGFVVQLLCCIIVPILIVVGIAND